MKAFCIHFSVGYQLIIINECHKIPFLILTDQMWIFSVLLLYEFKNTRKKGDFHCKHLFLTIAPTCNELYRPARSLGERSYMYKMVFFLIQNVKFRVHTYFTYDWVLSFRTVSNPITFWRRIFSLIIMEQSYLMTIYICP